MSARSAGAASYMRAAGHTLMELLVLSGIVAACTAVAVQSYRGYLVRARRSEAVAALIQLRVAEEKQFLSVGKYVSIIPSAAGLGDEPSQYDLKLNVAEDGLSYMAIATPRSGSSQAEDTQCLDFTIDQRGLRGVTGPAGVEGCWN